MEQRRTALLSRKQKVVAERDEARRRIAADAAEEVREIERELALLEAAERRERRKEDAKRAWVIGEFVLRNGSEDQLYKAIVESPEFDEFLQGPRRAGLRKRFGLPEVVESTPTQPAEKRGRSAA
ncbi:hypothetical protein EPN44_14365 [bacterium]|nr:MAG: hypothetical protein EPN44_14365 [bacterium]